MGVEGVSVVELGERRREWAPGRPLDVRLTMSSLGHGARDPAQRSMADGSVWRAARTPDGPGTLLVAPRPGDVVEARAWGPGAVWLLDHVPAWLGAHDDDTGFEPVQPALRYQHARRKGLRVPRSGLVIDSLVPTILEQKVASAEAHRSWRLLVERFGERAPAPPGAPPLAVAPAPATWVRIPSWEWHGRRRR